MDPLRAILAEYMRGALKAGGPVVGGVILLPILGTIALFGVPFLGGGILLVWVLLGVALVSCLLAPSTAVSAGSTLLGRTDNGGDDNGSSNNDETDDNSGN